MSEREARQGRMAMDHVPGGLDTTEADVLRRYADRLAVVHGVADARTAIERHVRARAAELGLVGLDIREDHAEEGVGTLRIHYLQHHHGLPVLDAGIEVSADIARASVLSIHSTIDEGLGEAPDPRVGRTLEAAIHVALEPFAERYGAAVVVGVRTGYLRDRSRPPLPRRDNHTASHELLRTGLVPDGMLHLVHELSVETTMPFERFRVVVDAEIGSIRAIELLSIYITEAGSVFLPQQVPSGPRPSASTRDSVIPGAGPPVGGLTERLAAWTSSHAPPPFGRSTPRVCATR